MVRVPGGRLNGLLEVSLAFRHLGEDSLLDGDTVFRDGQVYLDQARIRTGLELELGGTLGVFGYWQAREMMLKILSEGENDSYHDLTQSRREIGPQATVHRLRVGLRLGL